MDSLFGSIDLHVFLTSHYIVLIIIVFSISFKITEYKFSNFVAVFHTWSVLDPLHLHVKS